MPSDPSKTPKSHTAVYMFVAFLLGILILIAAIALQERKDKDFTYEPVADELLKEFAIVLISVCGVSLFYERVLAERHFHKFHAELQQLIRQGETNSSVCAHMGVLEIFNDRKRYEKKYSFPDCGPTLGAGDTLRIVGRSLYFIMLNWDKKFKPMLEAGASLEICMIDPSMLSSPLDYLAEYKSGETDMVVKEIQLKVKPWLEAANPSGSVEVRFHQVHLLDSIFDVKRKGARRITWDLNFGTGVSERRIFYVDGHAPFGQDLTLRRYDLLWNNSPQKFLYKNGKVEVDFLQAAANPTAVGSHMTATS